MPTKIETTSIIECEGSKIIEELIGRVNSQTTEISIAKMTSPPGWTEPFQRPEFTEYTTVLKGMLKVNTGLKVYRVYIGQSIIVKAGENVQYSTPDGATYIAVCLPAFSPETVNRG